MIKAKIMDAGLSLLREGYEFISRRCDKHATDIFKAKLFMRPVICMRGEDAAVLFYDPDKFTRRNSFAPRVLRLLQEKGSVTALDDSDHDHRKDMLLSLMTPERISVFIDHLTIEWRKQIHKWVHMPKVVVVDELHELIARAVCRWAGIPVSDQEACLRGRQFQQIVEASGSFLSPQFKSAPFRKSAESWARRIVRDVRSGRLKPLHYEAASVISWHRDLKGNLLPEEVAGAELLNILRPTVAVARWIEFAFHALNQNPECARKIEESPDYLMYFVHEVRRFYPLIPFLAGRVRKNFVWRGVHFPEERLVLLDLYGTNHDPRTWKHPNTFEPERFRSWNGSPYNFIPQGAGEYKQGHRCPGENLSIEILKRSVEIIVREITYAVPRQDLSLNLSRIPAKLSMMISSVALNQQKVKITNPSVVRI